MDVKVHSGTVAADRGRIAAIASAAVKVPPAALSEFWTLPGFCWNARVTTSFGDLPVQALRRRDPVRLVNGGFAQVEWVDEISLDEGFLAGFPDAQPITLAAGAFGPDRPRSALTLSPHPRVAVGESVLAGTTLRPRLRQWWHRATR